MQSRNTDNSINQNRNTDNSITPIDPIVADIVNQLNANLREDFEERAAIIEYDGQLDRAHAECLALLDVLRRHPEALGPAHP